MFDRKCNPDKTNVLKYSQQWNNVGMSECPVCFWSNSQRCYLSSQPGFISKGLPPSSFLVISVISPCLRPSNHHLWWWNPHSSAGKNLHCMENHENPHPLVASTPISPQGSFAAVLVEAAATASRSESHSSWKRPGAPRVLETAGYLTAGGGHYPGWWMMVSWGPRKLVWKLVVSCCLEMRRRT